MKLTDFERVYLRIKPDEYGFNPYVIKLFHTLLQKVEREPYRKWTHDLLRNYVNAAYQLCITLNTNVNEKEEKKSQCKSSNDDDNTTEENKINLYKKGDLNVYFTGLYTPKTYQGLKNGLYFVGNPSNGFSVMTRKEILEASEFDGNEVLKHIDHRDSFENELAGNEDLKLVNIRILNTPINSDTKVSPMCSDTAYNISQKGRSDIREEIAGKRWLHLLKDGIDDVPEDFVRSFFNISRKKEIDHDKIKGYLKTYIKKKDIRFEYYQQIIIDTINKQNSNKEYLPIIFYINPPKDSNEDKNNTSGKDTEAYKYNYLLPMYLLNSEKPDFCIVLARIEDTEGDWEPVTSLNMDEVYCDIRVFGKDAIERVRDWW